MRNIFQKFLNNGKKFRYKFFKLIKNLYLLGKQNSYPKKLLIILGCQRSGTTLLYRIFQRDWNIKVYGEFSKLNSLDKKSRIRLNPYDMVQKQLNKVSTSLIIFKPLFESQNANKLLASFKGSKILWIYREYLDVANSNIQYFGKNNGINNLKPICDGDPNNWRSEGISGEVRDIILTHYSEDMNPYDAAALFWYSRNCLFFELELLNNPNVFLCKYDDLTKYPIKNMKNIYDFINCKFPGKRITKEIHSTSIGKGSEISLTSEIDLLCKKLYNKLEVVYQQQ